VIVTDSHCHVGVLGMDNSVEFLTRILYPGKTRLDDRGHSFALSSLGVAPVIRIVPK
jgi:hypothetical protein